MIHGVNGSAELDVLVRAAAFDALRGWQELYGEVLDVDVLRRGVEVQGQRVAIFNLMRGIHSPRQLDAALAATTAPPKVGKEAPYEDYLGGDGLFRYHFFGDDPQASDNRMLRACLQRGLPIVYYYGVVPGRYLPYFPVPSRR